MSETTFDEPAGHNSPLRQSLGRASLSGCLQHQHIQHLAQQQDQNSLERALAQIIETANGHRAKGLPKGSPAYLVLRDNAKAKIKVFAMKWDVDITVVEAQAPALGRSG